MRAQSKPLTKRDEHFLRLVRVVEGLLTRFETEPKLTTQEAAMLIVARVLAAKRTRD